MAAEDYGNKKKLGHGDGKQKCGTGAAGRENYIKKEDFLAETWMRRKSLWGQDLTEEMTERTPGGTESERRL